MSELAVVEADVARDRAEMIALYRRVHPETTFDDAQFRWRYLSAPGRSAKALVVRDEARIVAQLGFVPHDVGRGPHRARGWLMLDSMTDPDAPPPGASYVASRGARSRTRSETARCSSVIRTSAPSAGIWRAGFETLRGVPELVAPAAPVDAPSALARIESLGPWLDALWARVGRIGLVRDVTQMRWRLARPGATYNTYATAERDAFVATKHYVDAEGRGLVNIVELLVAERARVADAIQIARSEAAQIGAHAITTWCGQGDPTRAILEAHGFVARSSGRIEIFFGEREAVEPLSDWHVAQLDCDVY